MRRPHFFWQGILIVLPALLLAGMGLYALRQDWMLARVEAEEQAKRLVSDLTKMVFPRVLERTLDPLSKMRVDDRAWQTAAKPENEALVRLRNGGGTESLVGAACLIDSEGELVYPPAVGGLVFASPLTLEDLNPAQQSAWFHCEEMWVSGRPDMQRVDGLAALGVPERLITIARFQTAVALMKLGPQSAAETDSIDSGIAELKRVRESKGGIVSESGIPMRDLAALQLALLSGQFPVPDRADAVDRFGGSLLAAPSPLADAMWEELAKANVPLERWQIARKLHAEGRKLHAAIAHGKTQGLLELRGVQSWLLERPVGSGTWVVALPIAKLREAFQQVQIATVKPALFGVEVRLGETSLLPRKRDLPVLAQERSTVTGLPLEVGVFLTDPVAFDAKRAQRARLTMALIGAAVVAVLVGFFAAWRAFRRQQHLSEMKTNFVSSVSHELRAPIASVQLMAEELIDGERPSDEKLAQYHRFIGQECRRLSGVIENVLDFARREQGRERFDFEATDLVKLVVETVQLMRPYAAERGVRIAEVCQGPAQPMMADGHALQRILVNLLDNAIKHSPEGNAVVAGLEFEAARVLLWVEDNGQGIPPSEQQRIFEKFYRIGSELQRQTQGVGLGLSIVKHLAEVHGGSVSVHSQVGEGSRFVVELPIRAVPIHDTPRIPVT